MTDTIPAATIPGVLRAAAETFADRVAYVEDDQTLTFSDLLSRVRRTAAGYRDLGVSPGDRVVVWAPNSIDWVVAALAVSYAGGALVPANSRYTGHEVADLVDRTSARLLVLADGFLGRSQREEVSAASSLPSLIDTVDVHELPDAEPGDIDEVASAVRPDDVADILFTSGTTGQPKGAMSAHRQTVGVARAWGELGGVHAGDRYLVVNPFFHAFGYKVGIITGLVTGATLYPLATFDVEQVAALVESEQITVLPGAPAIFSSILAAGVHTRHDLSSIRLAVTGAAVIPVVLIERMRAAAPDGLAIEQVVTAFGMTEAVVVTMCRGDESAETVATSCGRAVPGMETRIDVPDGAPEGTAGELLVRGENVMLGYLDDPAATAEAIDADGWLHTGDVGTIDADGNLRITDRLKDMYISGGFNVYPAEVEQVLARLEGVYDVAVVGVPDDRLGEVGRAYVVGSVTEDAVLECARERLANYKVPRQVEIIEALPRNLAGKVLKNELRPTSEES
ncbi:AMP-binding protein [Nocardioides piscis]|uniref:AMP-binding protein n=1 Tax=Nocardioides piscis TaxID=2714938 RepID=A0A6G7YIX1_9ACTN|nr:AMP-binding protein [Nocardioides piscis]QIK76691.1 AMP-binding protein [Nocardioides piscis]